jgi:hypothetical protein
MDSDTDNNTRTLTYELVFAVDSGARKVQVQDLEESATPKSLDLQDKTALAGGGGKKI